MPKTLILRTFEVPKIWEPGQGIADALYRNGQYSEQILKWEPGWADLTVDEISFAVGIYTSKYFNPLKYKGTAGENQPSLIKMECIDNLSHRFAEKFDWGVRFFFRAERKLTNFQRLDMLKLDSDLLEAKKIELKAAHGSIPLTPFPPLSFTLPADTVKNILLRYGAQVDNGITADQVHFGRYRESYVRS